MTYLKHNHAVKYFFKLTIVGHQQYVYHTEGKHNYPGSQISMLFCFNANHLKKLIVIFKNLNSLKLKAESNKKTD